MFLSMMPLALHTGPCLYFGVPSILSNKVSGYLIAKELEFLGEKTNTLSRPFVVILGGAKVSDKITVIDKLLDKADTIIIEVPWLTHLPWQMEKKWG